MTKTATMRSKEGGEKTKLNRINELIEAGFVEMAVIDNCGSKRLVLTEDGKDLVAKIKKVRSVLIRTKNKRNKASVEEDDETS